MDFTTVFIFALIIILLVEIFIYNFMNIEKDDMTATNGKLVRKKVMNSTIYKQTRSRGVHRLRKI